MTRTAPHCPNPFTCDNDTLCALLLSQLEEVTPGHSRSVFGARMVALIRITTPVLVWVREHKGVPIHMPQIHCATELHSIRMLATRRLFRVRDPLSLVVGELPVPDMPDALIQPLRAYLSELPGSGAGGPPGRQDTSRAVEQHAYALSFFARACPQDGAAAF